MNRLAVAVAVAVVAIFMVSVAMNLTIGPSDGTSANVLTQTGPQWVNEGVPSSHSPQRVVRDIKMLSQSSGWLLSAEGFSRLSSGTWQLDEATVPLLIENPVYQFSLTDIDTGWAVGEFNIAKLQLGTWSLYTSEHPQILNDVDMVSSSDGWAVGMDGHISHYDGSSWTEHTSPTEFSLTSISMYSASAGWAVGSNGTVLYFDGSSWTQQGFPSAAMIHSILAVGTDEAWALGEPSSPVYHYDQGVWTSISTPSTLGLFSIDGTANDWWAAGNELLHFDSGTFTVEPLPATIDCGPWTDTMKSLGYANSTNAWAGGYCGEILHFFDSQQSSGVPTIPSSGAAVAYLPSLPRH